MFSQNWPSQYTYYGRYEDTGVTDRVMEYVNKTNKKSLKILDVGCSVGLAAKSMQENLSSFNIIAETFGIDVDPSVQEKAEKNLNKFILADILKVDLAAEFDIVICSKMVFFGTAKRKAAVLSKCSELLKSDGGLITDANSYNFPSVWTQMKEDVVDTKKVLWKLRFGPKASYEEIRRITEFRFKRKVILIIGKDEAQKYPGKILSGWKQLALDAKLSLRFEIMFNRLNAYTKKKPDYKKRGKSVKK